MNRPVYFDNHATTRVDPRVLDAMLPFFCEQYGNAASINHAYGWEAADAVKLARGRVADFLQTTPESLVFTSGATEANNLAIKGVMRSAGAGAHFITNAAEHRAVLDPASRLKKEGFEVTVLPVDKFAQVDPQQIADAINPETALVSVMWANNEVGTITNVTEIARICRERNVRFHCDAVQAVGKISVDLSDENFDLVSLSAHKMYGPKGVGALYVRRGMPRIRMEPQIDGGGHERRLRSGTLAVPLIVGFGSACEIAQQELDEEATRINEMRDRLWNQLNECLDGIQRNGHPENCLPGNLNISFERVDGDALMTRLTKIAVSSGSACTSANPEPSHVLRSMGISDQLTRASLRFGIGRFNTLAEIDLAVSCVVEAVSELRQMTAN